MCIIKIEEAPLSLPPQKKVVPMKQPVGIG